MHGGCCYDVVTPPFSVLPTATDTDRTFQPCRCQWQPGYFSSSMTSTFATVLSLGLSGFSA